MQTHMRPGQLDVDGRVTILSDTRTRRSTTGTLTASPGSLTPTTRPSRNNTPFSYWVIIHSESDAENRSATTTMLTTRASIGTFMGIPRTTFQALRLTRYGRHRCTVRRLPGPPSMAPDTASPTVVSRPSIEGPQTPSAGPALPIGRRTAPASGGKSSALEQCTGWTAPGNTSTRPLLTYLHSYPCWLAARRARSAIHENMCCRRAAHGPGSALR